MSKDEKRWRRLRNPWSSKQKEKNPPGLSLSESSHTTNDPSTSSTVGEAPPLDDSTTTTTKTSITASSSSVVQLPSQLNESVASKVPREVGSGNLLPSIVPTSVVFEQSLWALAYENLQKANPDLVEKLRYCVGISITDTDEHSVHPRIDGVAQEALKALKEADDSKKKLSTTSAKIRKHFEQAVKMIIASKDFISSAVSANPYAALAWTAVSLLLPLLLQPTQENEAAIKGLDQIANLMIVYRWHEKIYRHVSDFEDLAIRLYTAILEYEATLLVHVHRNSPKRWARDVFQAGDWSSRTTSIQQRDADCRDVTNAVAATRAEEWRYEEREWQDKLLQQLCQDGYEDRRNIRALYSNYELGKNVNPDRIPGTCEWFLNHTGFLTWRESQSSNLLWLSADPGCGKSVLSKYLVDRRGEVLTVNSEPPTLCYFFFKDGDRDRMDAAKALCALLHQLIMQQPHLYQHASGDFKNKNETFLTDFDALWAIFLKAARDPSGHEIVCVLDALDECQEHSRKALIAKIVQLYGPRGSMKSCKPILKFLVTSRPDFSIVRGFKDLTTTLSGIRLRGEKESEQISREIDLVIGYKVKELGSTMDLSESDQSKLRENLSHTPHRTYLWLHLTLDAIGKQLEFTKDEIAVIAKTIPKNVDDAYTAILNKSPDSTKARKLLHIVLAATRPLTLQEANVAMVMEECHKVYKDLDIWRPDVLEDRIKNMCGLFLSVVDSKVYLIHQTAREFLVCEEHTNSLQLSSSIPWGKSFCPEQSNLLLAKLCVWYLQLRDFEDKSTPVGKKIKGDDLRRYEKNYHFLSYAAQHWAAHFTQAKSLPEAALIKTVAYRTCDTLSQCFSIWFRIYREAGLVPYIGSHVTDIMVASYLGHHAIVNLLLKQKDVQANSQDGFRRSPLLYATKNGYEAVVKLLLEREDVEADSRDKWGKTPLSYAAEEGHEVLVKLLLKEDVRADLPDNYGWTPLRYAVARGHEAVVKILLEREDVEADSRHKWGKTPLSYAAERGQEAVVKLLLKREDVEADSRDKWRKTPLSYAADRGHEAVVKLLLKQENVQANSQDKYGRTPFSYAAKEGHKVIIKLLLERKDVEADSRDKWGKTPLSYAAERGQEAVVKLLLKRENVQADSQDKYGRTPLSYAAGKGHEVIVKLLLKEDIRADLPDMNGWTPLRYAEERGHEAIVKLLTA